jgi:hypothetical protein
VTRAVTEADVDALLAAGWAPVGLLWRDPADGALRTEAHALRLARKDAAR